MSIDDQVREFHRAMGQPIVESPEVPAADRVRLRLRLITEEYLELLEACGLQPEHIVDVTELHAAFDECVDSAEVDISLVADALADLDYVVAGTRLEFGIPGAEVAAEVHRSNMAKLGPDGKPVRRADGKIFKPEGWTPPDIEGVLEKARKP